MLIYYHRIFITLLVLFLFVIVVIPSVVEADDNPLGTVVVKGTSFGGRQEFVGITNGLVDSFLGIQFAKVGLRRFSKATLLSPTTTSAEEDSDTTTTTIDATSFGPSCWQALPPGSSYENDDDFGSYYSTLSQDEECLYLNIWRPTLNVTASSTLLPTMVYVHGGGFNFGSSSEPMYDGGHLAATSRQDDDNDGVIVVSTNYRLGLFGFLVTDDNGSGGLNGLHDQILALQWVQTHISDFGGNPNDVTLFGESAGSMSVCMLSVSPLAKGLFHRSILQSGECAVGLAIPNSPEVGVSNTQTILNLANASSVDDLTNVTRYPPELLAPLSTASLIGWHTVDGWVLPKQPLELYTSSSNDDIVPTDMIIGSNTYDSPFVLSSPPNVFVAMAMNMENEVMAFFPPDHAEAMLQAYDPETYYDNNTVAAYAQFWGDLYFRCASRELALLLAANPNWNGTVHLYNYAHLSSVDTIVLNGLQELADIADPTWASHAADVPMVFGTYPDIAQLWFDHTNSSSTASVMDEPTQEDVAVSDEMMARWISFVKTGDPNTADYPEQWTPIPRQSDSSTAPSRQSGSEVSAATAATIPTFSIQGNGGRMLVIPDEKIEQCTVLLSAVSPLFYTQPSDESQSSSGGSTFRRPGISGGGILTWTKKLGLFLWLWFFHF